MALDFSKIQNAFFPSKEISDPDFFVGRKEEIKNSVIALGETGSFIAIHGVRGVGKSSIAKQIMRIAKGDFSLVKILKIDRYVKPKDFNFLTIYCSCDEYTKNVSDLLKRIMIGDNDSGGLLDFTSLGDKKIESIKQTIKAGGSVNLLGLKIEGHSDEIISYKTVLSDDLIQQFKQLLRSVQKDNQEKSGLLIVIDEFDVLQDKNGFGSLVKTCSNDYVKFAICGIANTITELIENHTSIARQMQLVSVNKMPQEEMYGILKKAEHHVSNDIIFDEAAAHEITNSAEGFPYFVHLLGKTAFLKAFDLGKEIITDDDIFEIKKDISQGKLKTIYEDIYHSAVKESPHRELLLKLFAEENTDEIYSEPIYASAKSLGLSNPSQLMRELTFPQNNSIGVLTKIREQYFRFNDPVFKVYAKLRSWKFGM